MTVTTKVPLGADTLNRKWYLDVNTGTHASPTWTGVFGITEFTPAIAQTVQNDSDFDSGGWGSDTVTMNKWSIALKLARKTQASDATVYDTGQEVLRAASDDIGVDNRVEVRWYEYEGEAGGAEVEAYMGYASVSWSDDGGDTGALSTVSVTLNGQGARTAITHPATAAVPTVYSVSPATDVEAGGELVTIRGIRFTGATTGDILFGAVPSTEFVVHNDSTIYAVAPAQAAGAVNVTVENATGVSTDTVTFTYTVA